MHTMMILAILAVFAICAALRTYRRTHIPTGRSLHNPRNLTWVASEFYHTPSASWMRLTVDMHTKTTTLEQNTNPKRPESGYTRITPTTQQQPVVALLTHIVRTHIQRDQGPLGLASHPTLAAIIPQIGSDVRVQSGTRSQTTVRRYAIHQKARHPNTTTTAVDARIESSPYSTNIQFRTA